MRNLKKQVCVGIVASFGLTALAGTIYDTPAGNGGLMQLADGVTVGNEISLPAFYTLTSFSFEYYSPDSGSTLNSAVSVDVKFYQNNGPLTNGYYAPGTLLYDSGLFAPGNLPTGSNDISYYSTDFASGSPALTGPLITTNLTFTITFNNLGGNTVDLPLADAQPGITTGNYWLYDNSSSQWGLMTNSMPADFVVDFQGVPEPSVFGLGAIGSLLLLGVSKLKRKG